VPGDLVDVDAARHLLRVAALQEAGRTGRELEVLEAARDLPERVRRHLAVLGGEEGRDLAPVGVHQVPDPEHDLGALRQRGRAPRRERGPGGCDGGIDLLDRREIDLAGSFAGRGIEHDATPAGRTGDAAAADPVRHDLAHWLRGSRRATAARRGLGDLGHDCENLDIP